MYGRFTGKNNNSKVREMKKIDNYLRDWGKKGEKIIKK